MKAEVGSKDRDAFTLLLDQDFNWKDNAFVTIT